MPYTPLDSAALYSTAFRSGALEWAVWTAILSAMDVHGNASINPAFLAAQWKNVTEQEIEKAWNVHASPDPKSKNKDHEGRRLIPLEDGRWHVVSYLSYREKYEEDRRLALNRAAKRRQREREKDEQSPDPNGDF
jgi:hypothetical protein